MERVSKSFFALALLSSTILFAGSNWPELDDPDYSKGTIGQEQELDSLEDVSKVRLVSPKFSGEDSDIELDMPIISTVVFRSVKGRDGKEGMEGVVTFPPEPLVLGPLTIDNKGVFSMVDGVIGFTGTASVDFGGRAIRAKIGLRELKFGAYQKETPATATERRKTVRLVESCLFGIELIGDAKELEIIPGFPVAAKSIDLVLSSGKAPKLVLRGLIGAEPVVIVVTLDLKKKMFKLKGAVGQCRLIDLAPFLADTILEDFSFDGQWHLSTAGTAHFEGRLYGKTIDEKATIEFAPGVTASFDSIVFDYQKDRSADITIKTTFMGASIVYTGRYDVKKKDLSLTGQLNQLKLVDLIPDFKESDFKEVVIDATSRISLKKGLTITGGLHDSSKEVNLYGLKLRKIAVDFDTRKKRGTVIGAITALGAPVSAKFNLDWSKKPGFFLSAGFDETVKSWQPFLLIPKGDEKFDFLRTIAIDNPALRISLGLTKQKREKDKKEPGTEPKKDLDDDFTLEGDYIAIDELRKQGSHLMFLVSGRVNAGKVLADTVREVSKTTDNREELLRKIPVNNLNVDALFKIQVAKLTGKKEVPFNIVGYLSLPEGFALTSLLPSRAEYLKAYGKDAGTVLYELLDLVRMDYGKFVVTLKEEEIDGVKYPAGVSIDTNIVVGQNIQNEVIKSLSFMKDFFDKKGERGAGAHFMCKLDPLNLKNFICKIGMSTGDFTVSIPKFLDVGPFDFSQVAFDFVVHGDGLGAEVSLSFLPHGDTNQLPITFAGELKATVTALSGEASAAGVWLNPFGIGKIFRGGFTIGDLGFKISETYQNIIAIPETFGASLLAVGALGLAGKVSLGKTKPFAFKIFFKVGADIPDLAFEMRTENVSSLVDMLQGFLESLGIADQLKVDLNKLVIGDVEEAYLKFVPFGGNIGNVTASAGIGGSLYGQLFGARFGGELTLDTKGIILRGYLPDIKIGPLVLTQAGGGKAVEIKDQLKRYFNKQVMTEIGPEFDLTLSLAKLPQFKVNGEVRLDLPGAKSADDALLKGLADIEISTSRLAFESETRVGPAWAGMGAHIKGTTIHVDNPMQLLKDIQPKNMALEVEFTNSLSDRMLTDVDTEYKKLLTALDLTYKQFIEQADRATTDGDVKAQEAVWRAADKDKKRPFDAINEWIKWRYVVTKRDFERLLDPQGTTREFMKKTGVTKLVQDIARDLTATTLNVIKTGKAGLDKTGKLLIIRRLYWKGTVADLVKGTIPGVMVDISIGDKNYREVIGDLDFTSPDKFNWSLAQGSLSLTRIVARFLGELLGIGIVVPTCAPSVLVEIQNQREDLAVSVKDSAGMATAIPWRGEKNYVPLDILCQKRVDRLAVNEIEDARNSYTFFVNNRPVVQVVTSYGPLGKEKIVVVVSDIGPDGALTERATQLNYGIKTIECTPEGVAPFTFTTEVIREGVQSKIKLYFQEPSDYCPIKALVEVINQRTDLRVAIADSHNRSLAIPDTSKRAWVSFGAICRQNAAVTEKYTISVQDRPIAEVACTFGSAIDEYMQATISPAPGVKGSPVVGPQVRALVGGDAVKTMLVGTDNTRIILKVETVKEVGQSKFKIWVQKLEDCETQALVEAQNQTDFKMTIRNEYGKEAAVPNWSKVGYISFDTICASSTAVETAEKFTILIDDKPAALVRTKFGPGDKINSDIMSPDGTLVIKDGTWGQVYDAATARVRVKVESIWESGKRKFKFFAQKRGG